jgi:hypothetical protein
MPRSVTPKPSVFFCAAAAGANVRLAEDGDDNFGQPIAGEVLDGVRVDAGERRCCRDIVAWRNEQAVSLGDLEKG